jgi:hypothetical protein
MKVAVLSDNCDISDITWVVPRAIDSETRTYDRQLNHLPVQLVLLGLVALSLGLNPQRQVGVLERHIGCVICTRVFRECISRQRQLPHCLALSKIVDVKTLYKWRPDIQVVPFRT